MAPEPTSVAELATSYLLRQSWYQETLPEPSSASIGIEAYDLLATGPPGLARVLLEQDGRHFQLLIGWRDARDMAGALGDENAICGAATDGSEQVICYDALADEELARLVLSLAADGREHADRVRFVSSLVSHAALVFDERLFMKCYRVIEPGPRPEAEVLFGLDEVGFNALLAPIARWQAHGYDLALVREFLPNALEGRALALTSLRDLLGPGANEEEIEKRRRALHSASEADQAVASAGGDFASEMRRLGQTTARLHLALALAFGEHPLSPSPLASVLGLSLDNDSGLGRAIRLHGDYHLRRVMRSETGWLIAGFADDPLYASARSDPSLPPRTGSPLEDLADMTFALFEVAHEAAGQRPSAEGELALVLCDAWARHNQGALLRGYLETPGAAALLPEGEQLRTALLDAFVAMRAVRA